ncbi:cytochrome b/b6 domain-containing protein [Pseudomonadota bacterium]
MPDTSIQKVLIWDLPTRVFHWSLVFTFAAAWLTSESDRFLYHHVFSGYLFIGLLIFRLIWGMVGSHYARFRSFAHDWSSVTEYLKGLVTGQAARYVGHNPVGSYAIFAMLLLGVFVSISGLLVLGGEEGHGPLKGIVTFDVGVGSKEFHEVGALIMLLVVCVHFGGVIFESLLHKENLVWAMITGHKPPHADAQQVNIHALIAVLMLGTIFGSAVYYFHGYFTQTEDKPFLAFKRDPLPDNELWRSECGDCHLAFHPTLLPARSWQRLMEQQEEHFDENLALDEESVDELTRFLMANSSETGLTEVANRVTRDVPASEAPLRITETGYWKSKHRNIDERYWKSKQVRNKANCGACHRDAEQGWFEDSNMVLPRLPQPK